MSAATEMAGIVSFPSYHTILALLLPYAARGSGRPGAVLLLWNLAMMPSIVPIGGHYLTDQLGGTALTCAVIAADRALRHVRDSRRSPSA